MSKYISKPVAIEAIQWTGKNTDEVFRFLTGTYFGTDKTEGFMNISETIQMKSFDGDIFHAKKGDYIVKNVRGECYPCDSRIFELNYELVEE